MKNPIAKQMRRIKSDLLVPSFAGSRCSKNKTRWTHKSKKDRMKWSQQHITRAWETLKGNTHTLCYRLILDWKELLRSHILLLLSCSYTFRSVSGLYIYTSFFLVLCPSQLFPWNHGKIIECVCASVYCQSSEHNIYWKREKKLSSLTRSQVPMQWTVFMLHGVRVWGLVVNFRYWKKFRGFPLSNGIYLRLKFISTAAAAAAVCRVDCSSFYLFLFFLFSHCIPYTIHYIRCLAFCIDLFLSILHSFDASWQLCYVVGFATTTTAAAAAAVVVESLISFYLCETICHHYITRVVVFMVLDDGNHFAPSIYCVSCTIFKWDWWKRQRQRQQ